MSRPGLAARQALLDAAHELLRHKRKSQITLSEVSKRANVSRGSTYFFYKDIEALYASLLRSLEQRLFEVLRAPLHQQVKTWQEIFEILLQRAVAYMRKDIVICELAIGAHATPSLKAMDREADLLIADTFASQIERVFELPALAKRSRVFFHAVEIGDLMFSLSMLEHGEITKEYAQEATRAAVAYLELYLPKRLPRIKSADR
jgi:AcrR family transcriptional regulator